MFKCDKCGKIWSDIDAEENDFFCTRRCDGRLNASSFKTAFDGKLLDNIPFPIAYPWAKAQSQYLQPLQRLHNLIFTAYQAMRLTCLLFLSDYLGSTGNCTKLSKPLARMRQPHWGEWKTLTDTLANYLISSQNSGENTPHHSCYNLAYVWKNIGKIWANDHRSHIATDNMNSLSPFQYFQNLRNMRAHQVGVHDENTDEEALLTKYMPMLEFTLEALFANADIQLYRLPLVDSEQFRNSQDALMNCMANNIELVTLQGVHEDFTFDLNQIELNDNLRDILKKSPVFACVKGQNLPIYPFFLALDLENKQSIGLIEPVIMVDAFSEKKVAYLGVREHGLAEGLGEKIVQLLSYKHHNLGLSFEEANRWLMVDWARDNSIGTVRTLTMNKYFPECYLDRPTDRIALLTMQAPGKAMLITGEAGSGKSSMLCRFVEHISKDETSQKFSSGSQQEYNNDDHNTIHLKSTIASDYYQNFKCTGDVVIFLSGRSGIPMESGEGVERAFCRSLLKSCGVQENIFINPDAFLKRLDENVNASDNSSRKDENDKRKVWIILDAINEMDNFIDLARYLDEIFIPNNIHYDWLRVVISCRSGALISLAERHKLDNVHGMLPFTNEAVFHTFNNTYHDGKKSETWLYIPSFSPIEIEKAYKLRQRNLPERAVLTDYASLSQTIKEIIAAPIYFHIFHETWKGKDVDCNFVIERNHLFDAYIATITKELPGIENTIERIGNYMYEHENSSWPDEEAWLSTEEWIRAKHLDPAQRICTLTPIENMLSASLLTRGTFDMQCYQFSHQKICEQVLYRKLLYTWSKTNKNDDSAKDIFKIWLEKGARFPLLANAEATFFASLLFTENEIFIHQLPHLYNNSTVTNISCAIFEAICKKKEKSRVIKRYIMDMCANTDNVDSFMESIRHSYVKSLRDGYHVQFILILRLTYSWLQMLQKKFPTNKIYNRHCAELTFLLGRLFFTKGDLNTATHYAHKAVVYIGWTNRYGDDSSEAWDAYQKIRALLGDIHKVIGNNSRAFQFYTEQRTGCDVLLERNYLAHKSLYPLIKCIKNIGYCHRDSRNIAGYSQCLSDIKRTYAKYEHVNNIYAYLEMSEYYFDYCSNVKNASSRDSVKDICHNLLEIITKNIHRTVTLPSIVNLLIVASNVSSQCKLHHETDNLLKVAIKLARQSLAINTDILESKFALADSLVEYAKLLHTRDTHVICIDFIREATSIYQELYNVSELILSQKINIIHKIVKATDFLTDVDTRHIALDLLRSALQTLSHFETMDHAIENEKRDILCKIGILLTDMHLYDEALSAFTDAKNSGIKSIKMCIGGSLTLTQTSLGKGSLSYSISSQVNQSSIAIDTLKICINIGIIYKITGSSQEALKSFSEATSIGDNLSNDFKTSYLYDSTYLFGLYLCGEAHLKLLNKDVARICFETVKSDAENLSFQCMSSNGYMFNKFGHIRALAIGGIGRLEFLDDNTDRCLENLKLQHDILERIISTDHSATYILNDLSDCCSIMSSILHSLGRDDEALTFETKSKQITSDNAQHPFLL